MDTAWIALSLLKHVGGKTLNALMTYFEADTRAILKADTKTLRQVSGVGAKIAEAIQNINLTRTEYDIERWQKQGIRILTLHDSAYPIMLKALEDAPPTLFIRGNWQHSRQPLRPVAIVGTRSPSPDSMQITRYWAATYARDGNTIVSGLAFGVDALAHETAVSCDGIAIAVLGSGVLNIYPSENLKLAEQIMERGALACEVSPDAPVSTPGLVARNRIITGLANRVLIIETKIDGGAMHAARFAELQHKPLYAVKNNASGNQWLVSEGKAQWQEITPKEE